jgi:hypothetical protein
MLNAQDVEKMQQNLKDFGDVNVGYCSTPRKKLLVGATLSYL